MDDEQAVERIKAFGDKHGMLWRQIFVTEKYVYTWANAYMDVYENDGKEFEWQTRFAFVSVTLITEAGLEMCNADVEKNGMQMFTLPIVHFPNEYMSFIAENIG